MVLFKNLDEYKDHVKDLPLKELRGIANDIDQYNFPDRYNLLIELISEKSTSPEKEAVAIEKTKSQSISTCPRSINIIKNIYLVILIFSVLAFILNISLQTEQDFNIPVYLFNFSIIGGIYYGISKVKRWVVILTLLFSYWGVIKSVLEFLTNYSDIIQLVVYRAVNTLFLLFFLFQIYIFTKKETKEYFGAKGKIII